MDDSCHNISNDCVVLPSYASVRMAAGQMFVKLNQEKIIPK